MKTTNNLEAHWENVYQTKSPDEVSWTQSLPKLSLEYIQNSGINKDAHIVDIGGGDSLLVDHLLDLGYTNITVLDLSKTAIDRAKMRLGNKAKFVNWIVGDMLNFKSDQDVALWHDRAAFHFLTDENQIESYLQLLNEYAKSHVVLGTFSTSGPLKCSALPIKQYNDVSLAELLAENFDLRQHVYEDHITPFETSQNFIFTLFKRK